MALRAICRAMRTLASAAGMSHPSMTAFGVPLAISLAMAGPRDSI